MSEDPRLADEEESPGIGDSAPAAKRRLDPGFSRNMKIIAGGVVGILLLVAVAVVRVGGTTAKPNPRSDVVLGTTATQMTDGQMTPDMKARLEAKQTSEAKDAAAQNKSYIPPDPPPAAAPAQPIVQPLQPVSMPQGNQHIGESTYASGSYPVTQYTRNNTEDDARRREGLNRQVALLVGEDTLTSVRQSVRSNQEQGSGRQSLSGANVASVGPGGAVVGQPAAAPAPGASAPATVAVAKPAGRVIVPGLDIAGGELASDVKVPANGSGYASARVTSGPAAGAFLVGSARVVDEGLEIAFTQMKLGQKVYPVDAIVLDEQTASNAINGNVDRKVLQRYVLPVAFAAAQGYYSAMAQVGSSLLGISNGATGVTVPPPTTEQGRAAGIAAGMQIASQEVSKGAQTPIVVSREMRFPIGILFRAPVTEESGK